MKLLTSNIGWAATKSHLFWTTDGGAQWKDITPKLNHRRQMVSSVFFLDASTGWALLSCGDDRNLRVDDGCFELASTTDAGQTWSILHEGIAVPFSHQRLEDGYGFSGRSWLDFADPQHGWEILDISTTPPIPVPGRCFGQRTGAGLGRPRRRADFRSFSLHNRRRRVDRGGQGSRTLCHTRCRGLMATSITACRPRYGAEPWRRLRTAGI